MSLDEVIAAARVLAREGLVDAFGHVSVRNGDGFAMTPPAPLGTLTPADGLVDVALDASELPAGAPKEAWIHLEIYRRRPEVGGICRAQPQAVNAAAAAGLTLRALHGQGAFVGASVPVHDDATLVRDRELGARVAATLADGDAIVLRGNGAVTVGSGPGIAAALMHVLEASAGMNLAAASAGNMRPLSEAEYEAWRAAAPELLGRLWDYLRAREEAA
jgi:ribulose-5-phosphate 4-epimerase/fuculose-1-phosphate aldolase